jgi:hypothetical protein
MMIVPEAANMPPTPWQPESLAPGIWAGAAPRIWRTLSCNAHMPYMPGVHVGEGTAICVERQLAAGVVNCLPAAYAGRDLLLSKARVGAIVA